MWRLDPHSSVQPHDPQWYQCWTLPPPGWGPACLYTRAQHTPPSLLLGATANMVYNYQSSLFFVLPLAIPSTALSCHYFILTLSKPPTAHSCHLDPYTNTPAHPWYCYHLTPTLPIPPAASAHVVLNVVGMAYLRRVGRHHRPFLQLLNSASGVNSVKDYTLW